MPKKREEENTLEMTGTPEIHVAGSRDNRQQTQSSKLDICCLQETLKDIQNIVFKEMGKVFSRQTIIEAKNYYYQAE